MPPLWVLPAACGLLAVICLGIGTVTVVRARRALQTRVEALRAAGPPAMMDSARLDAALSRIGKSADAMQAEMVRASAALQAIADAARGLKLREAFTALRLAGTALRALRALF